MFVRTLSLSGSASLLLALLILSGCSELTRYRTTSFVSSPRPPERIGVIAEDGSAEFTAGAYQVAGNYQGLFFIDDPGLTLLAAAEASRYGQKGDPGIVQATHGGHFSFRRGLGSFFEFGGYLEVAGTDGSVKSRVGVLPLKGLRYAVRAGPVLGFQVPVGDDTPFNFVIRAEFLANSVPYSRYKLKDDYRELEGSSVSGDGAEYYAIETSNTVMMPSFSMTPALAYRDGALEGAVGVSLATHLTNDGFSYEAIEPIEIGAPVVMFSGEFGWRITEVFRISLQSWVQVNDSDDHFETLPFGARATMTLMTWPQVLSETEDDESP